MILKDYHQEWCYGRILGENIGNTSYQIEIEDGRGRAGLHYNDLSKLLVISK